MKTVLLSLTAAAALAAAVTPAAAQPWRDRDAYSSQHRESTADVRAQEWRIRSAVQQGAISRGEAASLFDELAQVRPIAWRLDNGRWNNPDYQRLAQTLGHVQAQLNVFTSRRDDRYARRDYDRDWRR